MEAVDWKRIQRLVRWVKRSIRTEGVGQPGSVNVARQVAVDLATVNDLTQQAAIDVFRRLDQYNDTLLLPRHIETVFHDLSSIVPGKSRPHRIKRSAKGSLRGAPLPVEKARETSLEEYMERNGFDFVSRGKELATNCPFHKDGSPSFYVNPAKNTWYCFGCGEGGDAISFVEKYEGRSFADAVKELARC